MNKATDENGMNGIVGTWEGVPVYYSTLCDWSEPNLKINLKIKKLFSDATLPTIGSLHAAGVDLYAYIPEGSVEINPYTTQKINTGLAMEIPNGTFGGIFARSGLATKQGLRPINCVGVVDSDYRGAVIVALYNDSDEIRTIHHGDRIAQLIIIPYLPTNIIEVEELSDTKRGTGGFGSTGVN